jgi:hypothetical protein
MTRFFVKAAAWIVLPFLAACTGSHQQHIIPGNVALGAPAWAHIDGMGRATDAVGRAITYYPDGNEWLALSHGHLVLPATTAQTRNGPVVVAQGCEDAYAAQKRSVKSQGKTTADCNTDTGGAISASPPAGTTSMTLGGDGMYTDQSGNRYGYCDSCVTADSGAQGAWLHQIGQTTAVNSPTTSVNTGLGFEVINSSPFLYATGKPPTAYKNYPSRNGIYYFNYFHFWEQHLVCHLKSPIDTLYDGIANDLNNNHSAPGTWGLGHFYDRFDFTFNDQGTQVTIRYHVLYFPSSGDFVVGSAYIPNAPGC